MEINRKLNDFRNQAVQCNQLGKPMIFIASFKQNAHIINKTLNKSSYLELFFFFGGDGLNGVDAGIHEAQHKNQSHKAL